MEAATRKKNAEAFMISDVAEALRQKVVRASPTKASGIKHMSRMTTLAAVSILVHGVSSGSSDGPPRAPPEEEEDYIDVAAAEAAESSDTEYLRISVPSSASTTGSRAGNPVDATLRDHAVSAAADAPGANTTIIPVASSPTGLWFGKSTSLSTTSSIPSSISNATSRSSNANDYNGVSPQALVATTTIASRPPQIPMNLNGSNSVAPSARSSANNAGTNSSRSVFASSPRSVPSTNMTEHDQSQTATEASTFRSPSQYKPIKPLPKRRPRPPGLGPLPLPNPNNTSPMDASSAMASSLGTTLLTTSAALPIPARKSFGDPVITPPLLSTYLPAQQSDSDESDDGTGMSANANGQSGRKKAVPGNKKKMKRTAPGSGVERSVSRDRSSGLSSTILEGTSANIMGHHLQQAQQSTSSEEIFRLAGPPAYSYGINPYYSFTSNSLSASVMAPFASPAAYGAGLPPSLYVSPPSSLPPTLSMLGATSLSINGMLNAGLASLFRPSTAASGSTADDVNNLFDDEDNSKKSADDNDNLQGNIENSKHEEQQHSYSTELSFEFGSDAFLDRLPPTKPLSLDDATNMDAIDGDIDGDVPNTLEKLPALLEDAELEALKATETSNTLVKPNNMSNVASSSIVNNQLPKSKLRKPVDGTNQQNKQPLPNSATPPTVSKGQAPNNMQQAIAAANAMFGAAINNVAASGGGTNKKKNHKSKNKKAGNSSNSSTLESNVQPVPSINSLQNSSTTSTQHYSNHNPPPPIPASTDPLSIFTRPMFSSKSRRNRYRAIMRRLLEDRSKWSSNPAFDGVGTGNGDNDGDGDWLCFFCEYEQVFGDKVQSESVEKSLVPISDVGLSGGKNVGGNKK